MSKIKPSVTELISLLDKPALMHWANKIGLNGIKLQDYKNKVLSSGTSKHKQIENYLKDNTPFENKILGDNFIEFFKDKEIINYENKIETEHYQGRYDIEFIWNDEIYIADFKSNCKRIYLEHKLQLTAYKMGGKCHKTMVISLPDFNIFPINIDYELHNKILINLSEIYYIKQMLF
tara:strand:- start:204 stop:734 length:531 start_codon:yes stop_codon:yes gene_type:complete